MADLTSLEAYLADHLRQQIATTARELRNLADDIDRYTERVSRVGATGHDRYATVVAKLLCDLHNRLPILPTYHLVEMAAQADVARASAEEE